MSIFRAKGLRLIFSWVASLKHTNSRESLYLTPFYIPLQYISYWFEVLVTVGAASCRLKASDERLRLSRYDISLWLFNNYCSFVCSMQEGNKYFHVRNIFLPDVTVALRVLLRNSQFHNSALDWISSLMFVMVLSAYQTPG